MALRLMVYLQTDYALELERRNSFQMKEDPYCAGHHWPDAVRAA